MNNMKYNPWIMRGIMTSCQHKRKLYLSMKTNIDPNLNIYFKAYFKILSNVIRADKSLHYNDLIMNSNNRNKTTWNIIKRINNNELQFLDI
jgi:hypothetical protein